MKALQITSAQRLDIIELPQPQPAAGEVLLRIIYVGFCGSDLNTFRGRNALALNPVIPGHEISAVIRYLRRGHCPTARLVSAVVSIDAAAQALTDWNAAPGKVFRILVRF